MIKHSRRFFTWKVYSLKGIKTNRQHEFLSDLERNYFYLTEYSNYIIDIREQFPLLPLEETIVIADELGIKHPVDPKINEPIVMTTDFLLTVDKGEGIVEVARTVKMKDELYKKRVLEKFDIGKVYWERRNVDWGIVTEFQIPKIFTGNISYIHDYHDLYLHDAFQNIHHQQIKELVFLLLQRLLEKDKPIREIANHFDKDTHVPLVN